MDFHIQEVFSRNLSAQKLVSSDKLGQFWQTLKLKETINKLPSNNLPFSISLNFLDPRVKERIDRSHARRPPLSHVAFPLSQERLSSGLFYWVDTFLPSSSSNCRQYLSETFLVWLSQPFLSTHTIPDAWHKGQPRFRTQCDSACWPACCCCCCCWCCCDVVVVVVLANGSVDGGLGMLGSQEIEGEKLCCSAPHPPI